VDITGKPVLLALGGRLFSTEGNIKIINPQIGLIAIDMQKSQMPEIFMELQRTDRIDEVCLDTIVDLHVVVSKTKTIAAIRRLLNDVGSFIAVMHAGPVMVKKQQRLELINAVRFRTEKEPLGFLTDYRGGYPHPLRKVAKTDSLTKTYYDLYAAPGASTVMARIDTSSDTDILTVQTLPNDIHYVAPALVAIQFKTLE
jgi:hypothetical protein